MLLDTDSYNTIQILHNCLTYPKSGYGFLFSWPYSDHLPYRLPVFPLLDFGDWKAGECILCAVNFMPGKKKLTEELFSLEPTVFNPYCHKQLVEKKFARWLFHAWHIFANIQEHIFRMCRGFQVWKFPYLKLGIFRNPKIMKPLQ